MAKPILIPLLNPNEPEAHLAALNISEGQPVRQGDLLCTLETTKSTSELTAEADGYIVGLRFKGGETVQAGEVLAFLADTSDEVSLQAAPIEQSSTAEDIPAPENLRISQPALKLARRFQLDLTQLPGDVFITENWVQEYVSKQRGSPEYAIPAEVFDPSAVLIYGGGGHGKSVIELLRAVGSYRLVGVVDDGIAEGSTILGLPVLGGWEALEKLYQQGVRLVVNAVGGIGNLAVRIKVFERISQAGFVCPTVVHPACYVEPSAFLAAGVQIFPHAYIGSEARLGYGCIVNTGAIVSHECQLGDYVNISPGAILAGEVMVGSGALVGMGVTINLRATIGRGARIGNGATVKSDVADQGVVRAGSTWPG